MLVKAAPGLKVPMEHNPKKYITEDTKDFAMPDTPYYRRMIRDKSLAEVPAEESAAATSTKAPAAAAAGKVPAKSKTQPADADPGPSGDKPEGEKA